MSKSLKKNGIYNVLKTCSSIIFPLITFPYISRVLQPENIGKINFSSSFVTYFSLISILGLPGYAIRECSAIKNDKEKLNIIANQLMSINIVTTVIAYVFLFLTMIFWHNLDNYRYLILLYSSTLLFTTLGADWLNTAMEDFGYITLRSVAFQFLALILMFSFVKTKEDYIIYAFITLISSTGASILNIWYRKKYCNIIFTFNIPWKKHLPPILYLFVMHLSVIIFNNTDITMLGLFWGDKEVGLYSTAHKILNISSNVVQSIILVLIPRLSGLFANKDHTKINVLLRKLLSFNILLGLPITIGIILTAKDILAIVGGEKFIEATPILQIMVICFAFSLIGGSFLGNAILIPSKQEKYYMIVCLITALCNVVLNYIFIPSYGAIAAAATTAFNGFLIFLLLLFKVDKNIKIERKANIFVGPILGCFVIWLCCHQSSLIDSLHIRITTSIVSSVFFYALTLILLKNDLVLELLDDFKTKVLTIIKKN